MKRKTIVLLSFIAFVAIAQLVTPPGLPHLNAKATVKNLTGVPADIQAILKTACFNCHSSAPILAWYDRITPVNFLVASHISRGNDVLNFSDWDSMPAAKQTAVLYYSINKIRAGEMPLASYKFAHPEARIDSQQQAKLEAYLKERSSVTNVQTNQKNGTFQPKSDPGNYGWVKPTLTGIGYIPDYRNWTAISTTDRFDNGTTRIIYANDVAVKAIQSKQTNPWPDGSILAKAAWKKAINANGIIQPGEFVQIEFMIKDAKKYKTTTGWGWARWKGEKLLPYGKSIKYANECISCHHPVRDNDNVFTKPLPLK